jgi:hypothetical protein
MDNHEPPVVTAAEQDRGRIRVTRPGEWPFLAKFANGHMMRLPNAEVRVKEGRLTGDKGPWIICGRDKYD